MRYLPELLAWEVAGVGLWLLTLSSISTPELVAAVLCALPCAALAVAARRAVHGSWAPRPGWLRWLLPLPVAVLADGVRVLGVAAGALLGRPVSGGQVRTVRMTRDRAGRVWRARQAAAVLLVTATPGSLVLHVDPDTGETLLHTLRSGRPRMEEAVRR